MDSETVKLEGGNCTKIIWRWSLFTIFDFSSLGISGSYSVSIRTACQINHKKSMFKTQQAAECNNLQNLWADKKENRSVLVLRSPRELTIVSCCMTISFCKNSEHHLITIKEMPRIIHLDKRNSVNCTFKIVSSFHISIPLKKDLEEVPGHKKKWIKTMKEKSVSTCIETMRLSVIHSKKKVTRVYLWRVWWWGQ